MNFHKKNYFIFSIFLFLLIYYTSNLKAKNQKRKLIDTNSQSLNRCADGPTYLISYYTKGGTKTFDTFINRDYVRPLLEIAKGGKYSDYIGYYIERLAIYFVFIAFAIIIIIFWIIFSCCWCEPSCCFVEKRGEKFITILSFIISIIFSLGCIACSISGFVYAHRYSNYLDGATCGIERIYYDMKDGQIKENNEKWFGFSKIIPVLEEVEGLDFSQINYEELNFNIGEDDTIGNQEFNEIINKLKAKNISIVNSIRNEVKDKLSIYIQENKDLIKALENINSEKDKPNFDEIKSELNIVDKNFISYKDIVMVNYEKYRKIMNGIGFYLTLVIYSVLLVICFGCLLFLILYFIYQKNYFILFSQIFWHLLIFLSIVLFILVAFFGMLGYGVNDGIAYIKYVFGKENINNSKVIVINNFKTFINQCLNEENALVNNYGLKNYYSVYYNYKSLYKQQSSISKIKIQSIENFTGDDSSVVEMIKSLNDKFKEMLIEMNNTIKTIDENLTSIYQNIEKSLSLKKKSTTNFFYFMDCSFLKYDLEMSYIILYDFQNKVYCLFIITVCAAFFSITSVVFMIMAILRKKESYDKEEEDEENEDSFGSMKKKLHKSEDNNIKQ